MRALIDEISDHLKLRVCRVCKRTKRLVDFRTHNECSEGRTRTCRTCDSERVKRWYHKNRKRRQQAANRRNREAKAETIAHFGDKCHDCGESFPPCVYDFHHLDRAVKDMNPSAALNMSKAKRLLEMEKCIMLCANCHRVRHFHKE